MKPSPLGDTELVNRLTQELTESRRAFAAVKQRLGTTSRTLEGRTQELTQARAALALLLATLDSATDGIMAMGHFGRAMHYNSRFIDIWKISADQLANLSDGGLLAMQLTQVKDPEQFLADVKARKARPDTAHTSRVELTDGRIYEWQVMPQKIQGKRVGSVTSFRDVTERERLGQLVATLEMGFPRKEAEADVTASALLG